MNGESTAHGRLPPLWLRLELAWVFSEPFPVVLTAGRPLSHLSPIQALLLLEEQSRKTFWHLVAPAQLGTWLQELLWQPERMIRKTVLPVGVWDVCLCVRMGVCSMKERNGIPTKKALKYLKLRRGPLSPWPSCSGE